MAITLPAGWQALAQSQFPTARQIILLEVVYDGASTHYMATEYIDIGALVYDEYLLGVDDVAVSIEDSSNVAAVNRATVRLRRGSIRGSGDTMDSRYLTDAICGRTATIRHRFSNSTQAAPLGTYVVRASSMLDRGTIGLELESDERMFKVLPATTLGDYSEAGPPARKYAVGVDLTETMPICLGNVLPLGGTLGEVDASMDPVVGNTRLGFITSDAGVSPNDGAGWFMIMTNKGDPAAIPYFLEYIAEFDAFAYMGIGYNQGAAMEPSFNFGGGPVLHHDQPGLVAPMYVRLEPQYFNTFGDANHAEFREMFLHPDSVYAYQGAGINWNQYTGWKDCLSSTGLNLVAGSRLCLQVERGNVTPKLAKSIATNPEGVYLHFTVTNFAGTSIAQYNGTRSTDLRGAVNFTISGNTAHSYAALPKRFDHSDSFFLFLPAAGSSCTLSNVFLLYRWRSGNDLIRIMPTTAPRRTGGGSRYNSGGRSRPVWEGFDPTQSERTSAFFAPMRGPNITIQPGATVYATDSPQYVIYYILNQLLGVPAASIDAASFDATYSYLITDAGGNFNDWHIGRQIWQRTPSLELVAELASLCGLLFWRSLDGKFKMAVVNQAAAPVATFSDTSVTHPIFNLTSARKGSHFSKYRLNYLWCPARREFRKSIIVDKDATVTSFLTSSKTKCQTAFTTYGAQIDAPDIDASWVWDQLTAENVLKININDTSVKRRWLSLTTKLMGLGLEPGDTLRTNHQSQDWSSTKDWQVRKMGMAGHNVVQLEAAEISTF